MRHSRSSSRTSGYTLIELMIVVVIVGVLAAVAIPAFSSYINKSRSGEAAAFLGVIKLRQASYRAEFGQYAGFGSAVAGIQWVPEDATVMKNGKQLAFPAAPAVLGGALTKESPFFAIGASPDGAVRFGYGIVAGAPTDPAAPSGAPYNVPATELDYYFIAQATTDLDGDGDAMVVETTSFRRDLWVSDTADGWD